MCGKCYVNLNLSAPHKCSERGTSLFTTAVSNQVNNNPDLWIVWFVPVPVFVDVTNSIIYLTLIVFYTETSHSTALKHLTFTEVVSRMVTGSELIRGHPFMTSTRKTGF